VRGDQVERAAHAQQWNGKHHEQEAAAARALACLVRGTPAWCRAAAARAHAFAHFAWQEPLAEIGALLCDVGGEGVVHRDFVIAAAAVETHLLFTGQHALGDRLDEILGPIADGFLDDPAIAGAMLRAGAARAMIRGDLVAELAQTQASVGAYERAGDAGRAVLQRNNVAGVLIGMGAYAEAKAILVEVSAACDRLGLTSLKPMCRMNLGLSAAHLGDDTQARAILQQAIAELCASDDRRLEAEARADLARVLGRIGELELAAHEAEKAVELAADIPTARGYALAHRAQVALARDRRADALADARAAIAILEHDGLDRTDGEALVRLIHAQALEAAGERDAARAAIAHARARVEANAARIRDPAWRTSFVERVADNAATVALDRAWNA
jgi:tetratricopeptide (TPR) repeat protein